MDLYLLDVKKSILSRDRTEVEVDMQIVAAVAHLVFTDSGAGDRGEASETRYYLPTTRAYMQTLQMIVTTP